MQARQLNKMKNISSTQRMKHLLVCLLLYFFIVEYVEAKPHLYLNKFLVKINGNNDDATKIARKNGMINMGQVGTLTGWYKFMNHRIRKRSLETVDRHRHVVKHLLRTNEVITVERLEVYKRVKRDAIVIENNDPSWNAMWYMHCGNNNQTVCPCSMRISDAWRAGYNGSGVVCTILDDGIEIDHPDIRANYDPQASYDINDRDPDPEPRYDETNENKHGTRCAGVVAMAHNNHVCGVGVAFEAKIGGVRMLDGEVTDEVEAASLNYARDHVDIYSASWGPDDDGMTIEGPGPAARNAFREGVMYGRGGRGSIFVWASGNGGNNKDSCSCDGYINSIYTIGVSSISQYGYRPWYLEACASTLASTYSSGEVHEGRVVTTDLHSSCTHFHTGTSASAPMASGLIALMLHANPELSWRDVQHVIVRTANSVGLHADDWVINGAGFNVSHVFGFGLMDALALTHVAKIWHEVPQQRECVSPPHRLAGRIVPHQTLEVTMDTRACHRRPNEVGYLEHVLLRISLDHSKRGDLEIRLTSPSGTTSNILQRRNFDESTSGFAEWAFMTTHLWGENPMGSWTLSIRDVPKPKINKFGRVNHRDLGKAGTLKKWQLVFYGTAEHPQPDFHFDNCEAYSQSLCHEECLGCCGLTARDCKACKHVSTEQGECVDSCSRGQYVHNNICKECWSSCLSCDGPGGFNCSSCHRGHTLVEGVCVLSCDQGSFLSARTQRCERCGHHCKTCTNHKNQCTSCRNAYIFEEGTCRPSCPVGKYLASPLEGCRPCHQLCTDCTVYPTRCTSCASNYVLHRQRCTQTCQRRHYPDFASQTCKPCHSSCKTCSGPGRDHCTSCNGRRVLRREHSREVRGSCQEPCRDVQTHKHRGTNPTCQFVRVRGLCKNIFWKWQCCGTCSATSGDFASLQLQWRRDSRSNSRFYTYG